MAGPRLQISAALQGPTVCGRRRTGGLVAGGLPSPSGGQSEGWVGVERAGQCRVDSRGQRDLRLDPPLPPSPF